MHTVLTIAGSDSSAGAGIQADLKTFAAHHVYGCSVITAVTAQNTTRLVSLAPMPPAVVTAQIDAVAQDFDIAAVKVGMCGTAGVIEAVADAIRRYRFATVVVDPVLTASVGRPLLDAAGLEALRKSLLPRTTVLTPNVPEAEALIRRPIRHVADMRDAAARLAQLGPRAVVIKGGHLNGPPTDVVFSNGQLSELKGERIAARHTHGTGCTFSAALAARLALGDDLVVAARAAKEYVAGAILRAPGLGHGNGPLGHF